MDGLLRARLRERAPQLCNEIETIVGRAECLLQYAPATFPTGTKHNIDHTRVVEKIASDLLPRDLIDQLTPNEIALLILACHLHDLGMVGTERDIISAQDREQVRIDHAIRIGDRIREKWRELGFSSEGFAELLGLVCKGHRPHRVDGVASWTGLRPLGVVSPGQSVRLRVLAALIYAVDELHIGADRAPQRDQDWLEISDPTSKMHWQRHRCIEGPTPHCNRLLFQVRTKSFVEENDLREQVLQKAFSARRDANSELLKAGLVGLNELAIEWVRTDDIKLQIVIVMSDLTACTNEELVNRLLVVFAARHESEIDLSELCQQSPSKEVFEDQLRHQVKEAITLGAIKALDSDQTKIALQVDSVHVEKSFSLAAAADAAHLTLGKRFDSSHEFDLLASPFGKEFSKKKLTANVKSLFGIDTLQPQNQFMATILAASPSAGRVLRSVQPQPSILLNRHLLALGLLTAASFDIQRRPTLMLDTAFRQAFTALSKEIGESKEEFIRFHEELALVAGYTEDHVQQSIMPAKRGTENIEFEMDGDHDGSCNRVSLTVSQSFPRLLPATSVSFAHVMLAQSRSDVTLGFRSIDEAPLQLKVRQPTSDVSSSDPAEFFTIGPGQSAPPKHVHLRASLMVDSIRGMLTSTVSELNSDPSLLPIMLRVPSRAFNGDGQSQQSGIRFYLPAMTCQQIKRLRQLAESQPEIEWELLTKEGDPFAAQKMPSNAFMMLEPFDLHSSIVDAVCEIDGSIPYPLWVLKEEMSKMVSNSEQVPVVFERYSNSATSGKPQVSSLTLRFSTSDNVDFEEEFLGFQGTLLKEPPEISFVDESAELEFQKNWQADKMMMFAASFEAEIGDLAQKVRDWAVVSGGKFPFKSSSDPPGTPIYRTRFELVRLPLVDREWYLERPIIARFRPMRNDEKWQIEAGYWESIGDTNRRDLLLDRLHPERIPISESSVFPRTL